MLLYNLNQMHRMLLIRALSQQNAWEDVAKRFDLDPAIHLKQPSAYSLISALENRNCTVENLKECLCELQLHEALSIISKPGTSYEQGTDLVVFLTSNKPLHSEYDLNTEKLRFVKQPYCVETEDVVKEDDALCIRAGGKLHLKVEAVGCPFLSYQWFRDNNNIPQEKTPELIITNFSDEMEGLYYCTVQQLKDYGWKRTVISEDVTVKINIKVLREKPRILSCFPSEKCVLECGQTLSARIEVLPGLKTQFTWVHKPKEKDTRKPTPMWKFTSNILEIPNVNEENDGIYECRVRNRYGVVTKTFEFDVKKKRSFPTAKRALIVTNSLYQTDQLRTPHNDAETLFQCLSKYNFECTMEEDLSAEDMRRVIKEFFDTVEKGAFGKNSFNNHCMKYYYSIAFEFDMFLFQVLFYFGGHGCMVSNSLYMMGCDSDLTNVKENQVVGAHILEYVDKRQPLLFISILDMCQTCVMLPNNNSEEKQSKNKWNCNVIQCCSTSQNRAALEESIGSAKGNSVYMKHFENIINTKPNIPFLDMVREVNISVGEETMEQRPSVTLIGRSDFQLSDPIQRV
ncbi:hypothetical protein FOCC_FOCC005795 [Frankliniella occidentalis]|nr:hypothetical protein FOCC_FOCC005795 [Frankliniella occidentalis]